MRVAEGKGRGVLTSWEKNWMGTKREGRGNGEEEEKENEQKIEKKNEEKDVDKKGEIIQLEKGKIG